MLALAVGASVGLVAVALVVWSGWGRAGPVPERAGVANPAAPAPVAVPPSPNGRVDGSGAATSVAGTPGPPGTEGRAPAPPTVLVHAAGAVAVPGLYELAAGARVRDLVAAAGGLAPDADPDRINLAAEVQDAVRVYVPRRGEEAVPPVGGGPAVVPPDGGAPTGTTGTDGATTDAPVALNTATSSELEALPGIGPATAAAIVAYRTEHGPFRSIEQLAEVRGIGPAKLAQLRSRVVL